MCQRFYASPKDKLVNPNGAIGFRPGGPFDCLGPYARVVNCPVRYRHVVDYEHHWYELDARYTAYATSYADSYFSVPAATRVKETYISGYFTHEEEGTVFCAHGGRLKVEDGKLMLLRARTPATPEHWMELPAKRVNK